MCGGAGASGIGAGTLNFLAKMEASADCKLISGDGKSVVADKDMLANASAFFRNCLSSLHEQDEQVIRLPSLSGEMVELILQIIKGDACVDVWAEENKEILEAAELVGIVPEVPFDMSDFIKDFAVDQVHTIYIFLFGKYMSFI